MEDRSNKTIICSVLFLDIVEYSKKQVTGQISLKDRFNTYLSEAIHDVPVTDRIILDTGDGAAVNFLGDVESALTAALRLRASLLGEDPALEPPLLVRIGINLGPVRLVRDINGQPNIVGDGINVAQRVMAFADPSQILVSRSYFDAVSRLSEQYTGMFHYQGSRTDKHVREHEIYAIGYPGDQTTKTMKVAGAEKMPRRYVEILDRVGAIGRSVMTRPAALSEKVKQADAKQRAIYAGIVVVPLLLLAGVLAFAPEKSVETQPIPTVETMQSASEVPVVAAVSEPRVIPVRDVPPKTAVAKAATDKNATDKLSAQAAAKHKAELAQAKKAVVPVKSADSQAQGKKGESARSAADPDGTKPEPVREALLSVSCKDDVQLFVDGANQGKFTSGTLTVATKPGKHKVILTHASFGLFTDEVTTEAGKTERLKPNVCN
jgi:hypothetical protein